MVVGGTLLQDQMIARVRQLCWKDERIVGAFMYGSFTKGEGDAFSDIEFYLYLDEAVYPAFQPPDWVAQIAPVALYLYNEFGSGTALFENLVRGEFHFERAGEMHRIRAWAQEAGFPPVEAMLIVDRTGELLGHLQAISGPGPARGTPATGFLVLASVSELDAVWDQRTGSWRARSRVGSAVVGAALPAVVRTPARSARPSTGRRRQRMSRTDLSPAAYDRYVACTASLCDGDLERAYRAAWTWGKEMVRGLASETGLDPLETLIQRLDKYIGEILDSR